MSNATSADPAAATPTFPPGYLDDNITDSVRAVAIFCFVLSTVSVTLRFLSRLVLSKAGLWWDDYLCLIGYILNSGLSVIEIFWFRNGLGTRMEVAVAKNPKGIITILKLFIAADFGYFCFITSIKCSILAFYLRIFGASIRFPVAAVGTILFGWFIGCMVASGLTCIPLKKAWTPELSGHCLDVKKFYIGNSVTNCVTDILILIIPIPQILKIRVSFKKKIGILLTFIFGGFVCIVSLVRLRFVFAIDVRDVTWGPARFVMWTGLETASAITSACIPAFQPLFRQGYKTATRFSSTFSASRSARSQKNSHSGYIFHSSSKNTDIKAVADGEDHESTTELRPTTLSQASHTIDLENIDAKQGIQKQTTWVTYTSGGEPNREQL